MVGSGAGEGDNISDVGTSTSSVPTGYGPEYVGKEGVGFKPETKDRPLSAAKDFEKKLKS